MLLGTPMLLATMPAMVVVVVVVEVVVVVAIRLWLPLVCADAARNPDLMLPVTLPLPLQPYLHPLPQVLLVGARCKRR